MALPDSSSHNLLRTINRLSLKRYNNKMQKLTCSLPILSTVAASKIMMSSAETKLMQWFYFLFLSFWQKDKNGALTQV